MLSCKQQVLLDDQFDRDFEAFASIGQVLDEAGLLDADDIDPLEVIAPFDTSLLEKLEHGDLLSGLDEDPGISPPVAGQGMMSAAVESEDVLDVCGRNGKAH